MAENKFESSGTQAANIDRASPDKLQSQSADRTKSVNGLAVKLFVLIVFLGMVIVNALASILPINGQDTGAVSDSYPNLFAPAGITFAIWGLIYLLLLLFSIFQFSNAKSPGAESRLKKVRVLFIISSPANIAWIFSWHYHQIALSVIFMLVILVCLILIDRTTSRKQLLFSERLFLKLPFSVYFGWISVATVANITTLMVDIGWDGFGIEESLWTVIVLIIATIIALAVVSTRLNWAYGAVFVWAYAGILIKHLTPGPAGFGSDHINVIITASICLGLIAASSLLALFGRSIKVSSAKAVE